MFKRSQISLLLSYIALRGVEGSFKVLKSGTASSTRYWDCSGGACGCAFGSSANPVHCHTNAMFQAPPGNEYGASFYGTAAVSETLGGDWWLGPACNRCWRVTGTSNLPGASGIKTTLVLKGANFCPPGNPACNGKDHFDIAAPGFDFAGASLSNSCPTAEPNEPALHFPQTCGNWMINSQNPDENCNCDLINDETLRNGCKNFRGLNWDNVKLHYEQLDSCPSELNTPCWAENGNDYPKGIPDKCARRELSWSTSNPTTPNTDQPTNDTDSDKESDDEPETQDSNNNNCKVQNQKIEDLKKESKKCEDESNDRIQQNMLQKNEINKLKNEVNKLAKDYERLKKINNASIKKIIELKAMINTTDDSGSSDNNNNSESLVAGSFTEVMTNKKCSFTRYIEWGLTLQQCALKILGDAPQQCSTGYFAYKEDSLACECCTRQATTRTQNDWGYKTYKFD